MSILNVFYIKLVLSALFTIAGLFLLQKRPLFNTWQQGRNDKQVLGFFFLMFRLIPYLGIYIILNQEPRSDLPFFFSKAESAFKGLMVYRDFLSFHAPLFSYIISLPLYIWYNPRSIVFLMVMVEAVTVVLTYFTYKKLRPDALLLTCLYWVLPASFVFVLLNGQEEIWFWLITLLMWRHILKKPNRYEVGIGLLFALGLICIKVTYIFFLFPLVLLVKDKFRMLGAMALVGAVVLGMLYYFVGDKFLMPIQHTSVLLTPNLFSTLRPFIETFIHIPDNEFTLINWIGLALTLGTTVWVAFESRDKDLKKVLPELFVMSFVAMMIFLPSSPGAYATSYLLVMLFTVVDMNDRKQVFLFYVFNWLTVVQPFIYVYIGLPSYTDWGMFSNPIYLVEYILQVLNVVGYGWIFLVAVNKIRSSGGVRFAEI